jgi:hypothetical protein
MALCKFSGFARELRHERPTVHRPGREAGIKALSIERAPKARHLHVYLEANVYKVQSKLF